MKQFGKILKFELKNYFQNKIFVGITLFLVVVITVVMFLPRIMNSLEGNNDQEAEDIPGITMSPDEEGDVIITENDQVMYIKLAENMDAELIKKYFFAAFNEYKIVITDADLDDIKNDIINGKAECAFVMENVTAYTYYVNNLSMYDSNATIANEVLQNVYRIDAMVSSGMSAEQAGEVLSIQINGEVESLGKDQMGSFFYTYIMIFALYMVILLYGQMIATNVATEKSSRAMEVLITSAKPTSMMFGKVFASCIAGLVQLITVFGSALLFYNINKEYWGDNIIIKSLFDMPVDLFLYMLLFFILGFLVYAFLYGAVGSTASKLEDINTAVMPITLLFIVGFFVVIFAMSSGEIDSTIMRISSYVPFTSPMAMFTRIAMSTVPIYEVIISVIVLIGSVFFVGFLSAKIYRVGVLMYGTKPKLSEIIKAAKKA